MQHLYSKFSNITMINQALKQNFPLHSCIKEKKYQAQDQDQQNNEAGTYRFCMRIHISILKTPFFLNWRMIQIHKFGDFIHTHTHSYHPQNIPSIPTTPTILSIHLNQPLQLLEMFIPYIPHHITPSSPILLKKIITAIIVLEVAS